MSVSFLELERIEARVLGALRCVDAITGVPIEGLLNVDAAPARVQRNRSGCYVIRDWPPLADHSTAFAQPPALPVLRSQTLNIAISDPSGRYLPRLARLSLPRDPNPANSRNADSLFQPAAVRLFPSAIAPTGANWSLLRVTVIDRDSRDALGGALLRVRVSNSVLARGLSDWRGEALVPVAGVPVTTFSEEAEAAVMASSINITLQALFDPASGSRTPATQVSQGRAPARLPQVDPDQLEANAAGLNSGQIALAIEARKTLTATLELVL